MSRILEDIRVVDLTQYQQGPVCTMLLGDLGADVIKVEPPWGDPMRTTWMNNGISIYFMALNSNKRSIALNLRNENALKVFKKLVEKSDIVVENYSPGTMNRLGIGYETLKEINPKIILASLSGFGQTGPYTKRRSFDLIAQAMSGYMTTTAQSVTATTGIKSIPPVLVTDAPGDTYPGTIAALSILAAIYNREKTGEGQWIDVAQLDTMIFLMAPSIVSYLLVNLTIPDLRMKAPPGAYGLYKSIDKYVAIGAAPAIMDRLSKAIDVENVDRDKVKEWVSTRTAAEVEKVLIDAGVPFGPVRDVKDVVDCPQVLARNMIVEVDHPTYGKVKVVGVPMKLSKTPGEIRLAPPTLGQHTNEILMDILGFTSEDVVRLKEERAVV